MRKLPTSNSSEVAELDQLTASPFALTPKQPPDYTGRPGQLPQWRPLFRATVQSGRHNGAPVAWAFRTGLIRDIAGQFVRWRTPRVAFVRQLRVSMGEAIELSD